MMNSPNSEEIGMLALKKGPYMLIFKKKAIFPTVHWPVTGAPKLSLDLTDSIVQICYANLPHSITYYSVDLISKSQLVRVLTTQIEICVYCIVFMCVGGAYTCDIVCWNNLF